MAEGMTFTVFVNSITTASYMQGQCISVYTRDHASRCSSRITAADDICSNVSIPEAQLEFWSCYVQRLLNGCHKSIAVPIIDMP